MKIKIQITAQVRQFNHGVIVYGNTVLPSLLLREDFFFTVRVNAVLSVRFRTFSQLFQILSIKYERSSRKSSGLFVDAKNPCSKSRLHR